MFPESLGGGSLSLVFPGISLFQNVGRGWEDRPETVLPSGIQVSTCKGTLPWASLPDTLLEGTLKASLAKYGLSESIPDLQPRPGPLGTPQMSYVSDTGGAEPGALVLQVDLRGRKVGNLARWFLLDHMCCSLTLETWVANVTPERVLSPRLTQLF